MGIIYKQTQKIEKAQISINNALKIRAKVIGQVSLPVAQVKKKKKI